MSRPIKILVIGDSISQGAVSDYNGDGSYAVQTDPNQAWYGVMASQLETNHPGEYEITCTGIGGSSFSGWLRGSTIRTHSTVPTVQPSPPIANLTIPDGPGEAPFNGQSNLWDWGVAPYLPADLVMIMGELNQLATGRGTKPTGPYHIFWTLISLILQLRENGANAIMLSCHGQPERAGIGFGGTIPPGVDFQRTMNQVGDSILGLQWLADWLVQGLDSRVILNPSDAFYGRSLENAVDQDVHPNQLGHANLGGSFRFTVERLPRYLLQPDQDGT